MEKLTEERDEVTAALAVTERKYKATKRRLEVVIEAAKKGSVELDTAFETASTFSGTMGMSSVTSKVCVRVRVCVCVHVHVHVHVRVGVDGVQSGTAQHTSRLCDVHSSALCLRRTTVTVVMPVAVAVVLVVVIVVVVVVVMCRCVLRRAWQSKDGAPTGGGAAAKWGPDGAVAVYRRRADEMSHQLTLVRRAHPCTATLTFYASTACAQTPFLCCSLVRVDTRHPPQPHSPRTLAWSVTGRRRCVRVCVAYTAALDVWHGGRVREQVGDGGGAHRGARRKPQGGQ